MEKWWQKNSDIPEELNDVPMFVNKTKDTKNSDINELNERLDKMICEFVKERDITDWWSFRYSIDDLQSLKEYGDECPSCDRVIRIADKENNAIVFSM